MYVTILVIIPPFSMYFRFYIQKMFKVYFETLRFSNKLHNIHFFKNVACSYWKIMINPNLESPTY